MPRFRALLAATLLLSALATPGVTLAAPRTASPHPAVSATTVNGITTTDAPSVQVTCVGGKPNVSVSWVNPYGWPVFQVNMSSDGSFSPLYHKTVDRAATTTIAPDGFAEWGGNPLAFQAGTYYVNVFNWTASPTTSFTVPDCAAPAPTEGDPACTVKSVQPADTNFENLTRSSVTGLYAGTRPDANGVYQVYTSATGNSSDWQCLTCGQKTGGPAVDRNKMMVTWHPSGQWLVVGIESTGHDMTWLGRDWQNGLMESGIWLNIWMTTPTGDRWYQMTDFRLGNGPSSGMVGTPFTPDGKKMVWAEIVDGAFWIWKFGRWQLFSADFVVGPDGAPSLVNKKDITPPGARWLEPGNISPDGRSLLLSTDIGLDNAQGQDQVVLDLQTGAVRNLTNSPQVWDEHGVFSPNGKRISFMSSYPFRNTAHTWELVGLKTEIMLMDVDGSHLEEVTHFNSPGYAEFQPGSTVAATGGFIGDGSQMFVTAMGPRFTKTNWLVTFQGRCG